MTTNIVAIPSTGGPLEGALYEPAGTAKVGAIVVIHEWHGLNDVMKLHGREFAEAGFLAVVPDLFHGKVARDDAEAAALLASFDFQAAVREIGEVVAYLRTLPAAHSIPTSAPP